jgi:hypothetical protein
VKFDGSGRATYDLPQSESGGQDVCRPSTREAISDDDDDVETVSFEATRVDLQKTFQWHGHRAE